ncbi:MAG TPA: 3-phosphoshikimate 1-carboxyvinyltransferase [Chlamydiales bacterium]|nr:3-phosphoshikimate 1-carboxyvinyltransferase [Chlamydiales bacterium]
MTSVKIKPGKIHGEVIVPSSKSHTMRALLFALMAKGKSHIRKPLPSPDTYAMLDAIRHLGAKIDMEKETLIVEGVAGKPHAAEDVIQCGNSGQVLRFIGALAALLPSYTVLTGDVSIRHNRPVKPLLDGLTQLGALAVSSRLDDFAPIVVRGPIKHGKATILGLDSQPVSGLLMLGAFSPLELHVTKPGEKPWIDLTLSWFDRFGITYENHNYEHYKMKGHAAIKGFEYAVPGDFSSALFPIAASLVTHSELVLDNLDPNDVQGDKAVIPVLETMGARFERHGSKLSVKKGPQLNGMKIRVNDFVDALPILAVIGCFANGKTELVDGAIAKAKESNRIHAITTELKKMGADVEELPDGLIVRPSKLRGSHDLQSHHDHRLAMALSVAALAAEGESTIHGIECTLKSYATFYGDLLKSGAQMEFMQ